MAQSQAIFLAAAAGAAQRIAKSYGLTPQELHLMLITAAALEGGIGDKTGVGDGGQSHGRYQFYTGGGHGTTLLRQGWTVQDFYDDRKVVEHWAPILAGSLVKMKKQGYTGGEAIRQAIYAAERPAVIYPMERFNNAVKSASGLMGGAPDLSSTQSTGAAAMSNVDPRYAALVESYNSALEGWQGSGAAQYTTDEYGNQLVTPEYQAYESAYLALQDYISVFGAPDDPESGADAAQRAFENQLAIEGFEETKLNNAFSRWLDKSNMARTSAVDEINSKMESNASRLDTQQARAESATPGLVHRAVEPYRIVPDYEKTLAKWNEHHKVGEMPTEPEPGSGGGLSPGDYATYGAGVTVGGNAAGVSADAKNVASKGAGMVGKGVDAAIGAANKLAGSNTTSSIRAYGHANENEWGVQTPRSAGGPASAAIALGDKIKARVKSSALPWWKDNLPRFKDGVMGFEGGEAMVGEAGPEIIQVPGLGEMVVDQPTVKNLPPGTNVIPMEQQFIHHQIQQAAKGGAAQGGGDPRKAQMEQYTRQNDPDLQNKVRDSMAKAMAAGYATDPPGAPQLLDPRVKDRWAIWRPLHPEQQAQQQQPQQGAPR